MHEPNLSKYTIVISKDNYIIACGDNNLFNMIYGFNISKLIGKQLSDLPIQTPVINIMIAMIKKVKETKKIKSCLAEVNTKNYICICFPVHGETDIISFVFIKQQFIDLDISIFDD